MLMQKHIHFAITNVQLPLFRYLDTKKQKYCNLKQGLTLFAIDCHDTILLN